MILPLAASADNVAITKTLTYNFTRISDDGLVSNNPWGGGEKAFWSYVSGSLFWSSGASAVGARCSVYSRVYTWSKETYPEVIQKVTINAGAWSDGPSSLKLNNREVSLKTMTTSAYAGDESRIKFDDYVFENVITSDNKGHLLLDYITSGQADIFIRSITIEYKEGGECDMSEVPTDNAFYAATSFLCERGVLDGSRDDGKYSVEEKLLRKHLANITFRGLFTLNGREIPSTFVSDQYPAVYDDLKSDAPYYQAAKALLYLDYGDGITPFDRDRDGFFPEGYESRINILKELMEAFNIKPDTEGNTNPFPNEADIAHLSETSPIRMGYVRRAAKLGIITTENTDFHPYRECLRGEAFLMLARIIQKIEAGEIADPNPQEGDFLDPNSGTGTVDGLEPYAVLSNKNTVLTFYYDDQKTARNGMSVGPFTISADGRTSSGWDAKRQNITSVVFDASFANCTTLTSTAYWFYSFVNLSTITGIGNLKTDNVTDMRYMFAKCNQLMSLDVTRFKTDKVTNMSGMFQNLFFLSSLDVRGFKTDNVTDMSYMFAGCSLRSLDVTGFKTDNVTNMSYMFAGTFLKSLDLKGFKTDKVRNMSEMFCGCEDMTSLDVTGFKTDNVTDMSYMFQRCSGLKSVNLSVFKTDKVTDMRNMFSGCSGLKSLDLSGFKTNKVTDMSGMFYYCSSLTSLDLKGFETDNVTYMSGMFQRCNRLKSLDLSGFKTDNVTDMSYMFYDCSSLTSLDVTGFKTNKVTDMSGMFYYCSSLTSLDISGFKTNKVTRMSSMFGYCSGLTSLDLSSFRTGNVTNMSWMFDSCSRLETIYVGTGWSTATVLNGESMFGYCSSLVGGAGTSFDESHTDHAYARIDGGTANPGYFTAKAVGSDEQPEGDLNDDWEVDEDDVAVLVSVVMGGNKNKLADADLNHDKKVDAADVVTLVKMIMSQK